MKKSTVSEEKILKKQKYVIIMTEREKNRSWYEWNIKQRKNF